MRRMAVPSTSGASDMSNVLSESSAGRASSFDEEVFSAHRAVPEAAPARLQPGAGSGSDFSLANSEALTQVHVCHWYCPAITAMSVSMVQEMLSDMLTVSCLWGNWDLIRPTSAGSSCYLIQCLSWHRGRMMIQCSMSHDWTRGTCRRRGMSSTWPLT